MTKVKYLSIHITLYAWNKMSQINNMECLTEKNI